MCAMREVGFTHIGLVFITELTRFVIKPIVHAGNLDRVIVVVVLF